MRLTKGCCRTISPPFSPNEYPEFHIVKNWGDRYSTDKENPLVWIDPHNETDIESCGLKGRLRWARSSSEKYRWNDIGKGLTGILRVNGCMRKKRDLQMDTAGYVEWDAVCKQSIRGWKAAYGGRDPTVELMNIVRHDYDKCRFCIMGQWRKVPGGGGGNPAASRGVGGGNPAHSGWILVPVLIRTYTGHSFGFIDDERISKPILEEHVHRFSCLAHRTKFKFLQQIFSQGILPGVKTSQSLRTKAYFSAFASGDYRNVAAGRQDTSFDVELLLDLERAVRDGVDLRMTTHGAIISDGVPPRTSRLATGWTPGPGAPSCPARRGCSGLNGGRRRSSVRRGRWT